MKRILVVDDDKSIRELVRDALEPRGYEVLETSDLHKAIKIALKEDLYKVLCDTSLGEEEGEGDGLDLAIKLFKEGVEKSKIIGMSGDPESRADWEGLGFAYIQKPFSLKELYRLIREY